MGRLLLVCLLALGCSAAGESAGNSREDKVVPTVGSSASAGSTSCGTGAAGSAGAEGGSGSMGNFHDEGGSAGTSTTPVAGSGGEPAPSRGSAGQPQGGQPTAGTGGSTTEPDPFPSCGDGVCSQTDYGIEGGAYVRPNTAACNADCPQSCGNAKCDALHDLWNGCYEAECVAKPPEPIVLCPFPEWESPYLDTFVNPYYPNVPHVKWTVGDRVRRGNYCYRCTDYECQEAPPSLIMGEPWQPIGCEC